MLGDELGAGVVRVADVVSVVVTGQAPAHGVGGEGCVGRGDGALRGEREASDTDVVDVAIVGGGVAGMSAALEARKLGLTYRLFEATEPFSTIVNFPKGKPIYTYPRDMTPEAELETWPGDGT